MKLKANLNPSATTGGHFSTVTPGADTLCHPKQKKAKIALKDKSLNSLLKLAEKEFNKFIRRRDTLPGEVFKCPTCGQLKSIQQNYHACHVFSAGHYPALRFNENNVFGGCLSCNYFKHGEGQEYVLWLQKKLSKWEFDDLIVLKDYWKAHAWKWDRFSIIEIITKYKALNLQQGKNF